MSAQGLVAVLSLVGVIAGAMITGWYALKKVEKEVQLAPYSELSKRVGALEVQVRRLLMEQEVDRAYIMKAVPYIAAAAHYVDASIPTPPGWYINMLREINQREQEEREGVKDDE